MFRPLVCKGTLFWARSKARKRKRAKEKERARAKAKIEKISRASSQETMRLRKMSRRMAKMMARMRANCDQAEVFIYSTYISQNLIGQK